MPLRYLPALLREYLATEPEYRDPVVIAVAESAEVSDYMHAHGIEEGGNDATAV